MINRRHQKIWISYSEKRHVGSAGKRKAKQYERPGKAARSRRRNRKQKKIASLYAFTNPIWSMHATLTVTAATMCFSPQENGCASVDMNTTERSMNGCKVPSADIPYHSVFQNYNKPFSHRNLHGEGRMSSQTFFPGG